VGDAKSLWGRWLLIFLITGASVYAFLSKRTVEHPYGVALGQDLKGGTTLRFSLDLARARSEGRVEERETDEDVVHQTMLVIEQRIDKWGLAELSLQAIGDDKFEISLPAEIDVGSIERLVTTLGDLQFRIEVDPTHRREDQAPALWSGTPEEFQAYKKTEVTEWKAAREQARPYKPTNPLYRVVPRKGTEAADADDFAVLSEPTSKDERFSGAILANVRPGQDEQLDPVVFFDVKLEYQGVFGSWTEKNKLQPMAIVLSEELDSAPVIQDRLETNVRITLGGGGYGQRAWLEERQKQLVTVLQTGSLKVRPRLESKATVGPSLAGQAVRRGVLSTAVAFGLVLVFMLAFYLWAGMVANLALVLNLVLLMGAMAFLQATLTLPGIAGIVLTLGMAVDANILIYERIREEQARGRSLVQALSDGYDRAFTTIVDSNVTTFLTALFLYVLGSGAIKGFAVSLTLGLLASMFTAIYVTRTVFETQVARGRTAPIKMAGSAKVPSIRWVGLRRVLLPIALLLVGGSLAIYAASPEDAVYDIDFTGGMKLQARFDKPTSTDDVKKALDGARATVKVTREIGADATTAWREVEAGPYDDASVVTVGATGDWVEIKAGLRAGRLAPAAGDTAPVAERERLAALKAYVEKSFAGRLMPSWVREGPAAYRSEGDADPRKRFDGRLKTRIAIEDPDKALTAAHLKDLLVGSMPYTTEGEGGRRVRNPAATVTRDLEVVEVPQTRAEAGGSVHTFDLWWKSDHATTRDAIEVGSEKLRQDLREYLGGPSFKEGLIRLGATRGAVDRVALADPFPVDDLIGAGVAHRQRNDAILALLLSLVAIVIYVAFRFRSSAMGFSAVLCLFHDVTVALGAICIVDHLGLVDARINLGLVAAFLTIVGFSVNDTVVTFDRIRELRGKAPRITGKMIDDAVNQTLSRTWRTTATALMTVVVLFVFNVGQRSMLEGLSFTLMVGMVAGVYSTVAVAAPLLLFLPWFWAKIKHWRPRASVFTWALSSPGIWAVLGVGVATTLGLALSGTTDWGMAAFYGLLCVPLVATFGVWFAWCLAFAVGAFVGGFLLLFPWTRIEDPEAAIDAAQAEAVERERVANRHKPAAPKPVEAKADAKA